MMTQDKKRFYMECHIAGVRYHDAHEVWDKLAIGAKLQLERDADNKFDPEAVAVFYFDKERDENLLLGYIPRDENSDVALFLDMGWGDMFEAYLSKKNPEAHYEKQLNMIIKVLKKK